MPACADSRSASANKGNLNFRQQPRQLTDHRFKAA
jgi:hypothetical protein